MSSLFLICRNKFNYFNVFLTHFLLTNFVCNFYFFDLTNKIRFFRWEKYDTIGEVIENTRIVTFKTPLRDELHSRIDKSLKFTTMNLFRKVSLFLEIR